VANEKVDNIKTHLWLSKIYRKQVLL